MNFETSNGKTIELFNDGYSIRARFQGGGELPVELSGSWTDRRFAEISVIKYLHKMDKRSKKYKPEEDK